MSQTRRIALAMGVMAVACGPSIAVHDGDSGAADGAGTSGATSPDQQPPPRPPPPPGDTGADSAGESSTGEDPTPDWVDEAEELYPTFRHLFDLYLERNCSGFDNVCHSNLEHPDLRTAQDYVSIFGEPCDVNGQPTETFDPCEPVGDGAILQTGPDAGWTSEVGFVYFDSDTDGTIVTLRDPVPSDGPVAFLIQVPPEGGPDEWLFFDAVATHNRLFLSNATDNSELHERLLTEVTQGDPNRNDTFGADDPMYQLALGDVAASYLFARMVGDAPGSIMPLANQAPGDVELGALGCWIEQTLVASPEQVDAPIDYGGCEYAPTE